MGCGNIRLINLDVKLEILKHGIAIISEEGELELNSD